MIRIKNGIGVYFAAVLAFVLLGYALGGGTPRSLFAAPFSSDAFLGTDGRGFSMVRVSLKVFAFSFSHALVAAFLASMLGATLATVAQYSRRFSEALGRLVDAFQSFPSFIALIVIDGLIFRGGSWALVFAFAFTQWAEAYRVVDAYFAAELSNSYVVASRALGATRTRVLQDLLRTSWRSVWFPLAVDQVSAFLLLETVAGFFGLPTGEWSVGTMFLSLRSHPTAYWLVVPPAALLFFGLFPLRLTSDKLRNRVYLRDPRS